MNDIAILIPTLNPDGKILTLVKELQDHDMKRIFIVDDGSSPEREIIISKLKDLGCTILYHYENKGKWEALKMGIKYISKEKNIKGIITADGDGQHLTKDIKAVAEKMLQTDEVVLWTRKFDTKNMPLASKIWNIFSEYYYKAITGKKLSDTQTGLRGIPEKYFTFAMKVPGNRYEYEMRFLEEMHHHHLEYTTVDITTVYEDDRVSHFRVFQDSYLIYKHFFRNIIASLSSAILDVGIFMLLVTGASLQDKILLTTIIARIISGIYNFVLNKFWTFEKKDSKNTSIESRRYFILYIIQMFVSGILTSILNTLFISSTSWLLILKIFIDFVLFIINFVVQKNWVFYKKQDLLS